MRWEDERYVRIYTRDTTDWIAMGWEAQALLVLVLRKCDRAGILDLGKSGLRGLAALVRMPLDVVERAVAVLLEDGCIQQHETRLVVRNFVAAQETPASDAKRARERRERERAREEAVVTKRDATVTKRDAGDTFRDRTSRARPTPSRDVTLCCAVPSRTVPNQAPPVVPPAGGPRATRGTRLPEDWVPSEATVRRFREHERVDAQASLERFRNYWLSKTGRTAAKSDWERTFVNWVLEDIDRGKAKPFVTVRDAEPPKPSPDALSPADATAHFEQLEHELLGAGELPWERAG